MGLRCGSVFVTAERRGKYLARHLEPGETRAVDAHHRASQRSALPRTGSQGHAHTGFGKACAVGAQKLPRGKAEDSISIKASGSASAGRISNAS